MIEMMEGVIIQGWIVIGRFSFFGLKQHKKAKRYASFDDEIEMFG